MQQLLKENRFSRLALWALFLVVSGVMISVLLYARSTSIVLATIGNTAVVYPGQPTIIAESNETQHVLLVGDIMLDRGVDRQVQSVGEGDPRFPFALVAEQLQKYDLVVGNLEGPVSDRGANQGSKYSFRFAPETVEGLRYASFDAVSLANNHMWDWGRYALCDTPEILADHGIVGFGAGCDEASANAPYVTDLDDGTRLAFISFTNLYPDSLVSRGDNPGISDFSLDRIEQQVRSLKDQQSVDIVLLAVHWGEEYKTRSNSRQQKLAKQLVDLGVDVVVGHHPHVVQEVERVEDGWVLYSLGNFIFDQYFSEETMKGLAIELVIENGEVQMVYPHPYKINTDYQPYFVKN